jgi:hypothetical protein
LILAGEFPNDGNQESRHFVQYNMPACLKPTPVAGRGLPVCPDILQDSQDSGTFKVDTRLNRQPAAGHPAGFMRVLLGNQAETSPATIF